MKIAFIIPSLANKGPVVMVDIIIRHLQKEVEQIDVFYFDDKFGVDFTCPTYRIDFNTPIDFDKYDIIHSHMYRPDKYVCKWKDYITKAKLVSTIHQDILNNVRYSHNIFIAYALRYVWKKLFRQMDAIGVISKQLLELYTASIPRTELVYNGVDIDYSPTNCDPGIINQIKALKDKGYKVIGTYAVVDKRKGIDQMIDVAAIRNDIAIVVIGEGKGKEHLRKYVEAKGWNDRVLFFPYLKHPYNYLKEIDVYVMPSRSEGFGLAVVEAALTGTPVICSNIEVFHEIFDETEATFFELENIESLSKAVDVAFDRDNGKVERALVKVKSRFSGRIMAGNYLKLYRRLECKG